MQIECILKREGGTKTAIGEIEYHFAPQADGAHVADVENEDHQDRFLAISEGYRLYRPGKTKAVETVIEDEVLATEQEEERASLVAQYEAKFGKKPHYKASIEKIREALEAE